MKRTAIIFLILSFLFFKSNVWAIGLIEAKITVNVVDETEQPVDGAKVGLGFQKNTGWGTEEIPVIGFSDGTGLFTGSAYGNDTVGFTITKDGYYNSYGVYEFKEKKLGRWEPWNPIVQVVLKKIEKPVPMYCRKIDTEIPVMDKAVGFDLIEYDWVPPYGKGKFSDIVFLLNKKFKTRDDFDATLTVTYSNKFDGAQIVKENLHYGSDLKLPRFAPKAGYQKKLSHFKRTSPKKPIDTDYGENNNYIFRIRSEEKAGKLFRAMYGKILGEIRFDPMMSKTAYILFEYYLNPDYTRNLEHGRNLFEDVKK